MKTIFVCLGARDLVVKQVNGKIRINEYDGYESVEEENEYDGGYEYFLLRL